MTKIKIASGETPRLPSAYQEVEYIESSGTQRIDTGVMPTSDTINQFKVMFLAWSGDVVYGYNYDDNTANYRLFNAYGYPNGTTFNNGKLIFDTTHSNSYARIETGAGYLSLNTIYELELGDYYVKDLSTGTNILTGTAGTVTDSGNYTITLNNYKNTRYSKNRWYYVKIFEGATQIRDLVPCYRIADNEIGMYDLINDTFYTNSGSGTFIKGSDVVVDQYKDIKKVYLGSTQVRPAVSPGWQPGPNTVLYCPLEDDILDHSGNHTMTLTTSSYGTVAKDSTGFYYFNGGYITSENYTGPNEVTVSMWLKKETKHISEAWCWAFSGHYRSSHPYHYFAIDTGNSDNTHNAEFTIYNGSARSVTTNAITEGVWTHVALTYSATTGLTAYVNGVSVGTYATTGNITSYSGPTNIGATFAYTNQFYEGYISEVIVESVPRTAQEVLNYYNQTKSNYGIS